MPVKMSYSSYSTVFSGWRLAKGGVLAGQRHIDGLGLQLVGDQALGQFGLLPLDGLFDLGPDLVGQLADDRPFFGETVCPSPAG